MKELRDPYVVAAVIDVLADLPGPGDDVVATAHAILQAIADAIAERA